MQQARSRSAESDKLCVSGYWKARGSGRNCCKRQVRRAYHALGEEATWAKNEISAMSWRRVRCSGMGLYLRDERATGVSVGMTARGCMQGSQVYRASEPRPDVPSTASTADTHIHAHPSCLSSNHSNPRSTTQWTRPSTQLRRTSSTAPSRRQPTVTSSRVMCSLSPLVAPSALVFS